MGDDRMTSTRYSRRNEQSSHEFATFGGIFQDRHMGTSQTSMKWMVRNIGETFLNIVGAIQTIFNMNRRSESLLEELEERCMANEAQADNLRDDMKELEEKVEKMRKKLEKKSKKKTPKKNS